MASGVAPALNARRTNSSKTRLLQPRLRVHKQLMAQLPSTTTKPTTRRAIMAKPRSSEAKLARLRELRGQLSSPQMLEELRAALRDASNFVVEAAAEMAGEALLTDLASD